MVESILTIGILLFLIDPITQTLLVGILKCLLLSMAHSYTSWNASRYLNQPLLLYLLSYQSCQPKNESTNTSPHVMKVKEQGQFLRFHSLSYFYIAYSIMRNSMFSMIYNIYLILLSSKIR